MQLRIYIIFCSQWMAINSCFYNFSLIFNATIYKYIHMYLCIWVEKEKKKKNTTRRGNTLIGPNKFLKETSLFLCATWIIKNDRLELKYCIWCEFTSFPYESFNTTSLKNCLTDSQHNCGLVNVIWMMY